MHLIMRTLDIVGCCSFGVIYMEGKVWLRTIEREWLDNRPRISCVPQGTYDLVPFHSPRYGLAYHLEAPDLGVEITGPAKRTHILIHPANWATELEGCIAPGLLHSTEGYGVLMSRKAVKEFNDVLGLERQERHTLSIIREGIEKWRNTETSAST